MTREEIVIKIERNRELIERALSSDLEPRLLTKMVEDLSRRNQLYILKLKEQQ